LYWFNLFICILNKLIITNYISWNDWIIPINLLLTRSNSLHCLNRFLGGLTLVIIQLLFLWNKYFAIRPNSSCHLWRVEILYFHLLFSNHIKEFGRIALCILDYCILQSILINIFLHRSKLWNMSRSLNLKLSIPFPTAIARPRFVTVTILTKLVFSKLWLKRILHSFIELIIELRTGNIIRFNLFSLWKNPFLIFITIFWSPYLFGCFLCIMKMILVLTGLMWDCWNLRFRIWIISDFWWSIGCSSQC